jgi:heme-degrading monooxygenase HmoA
MSIANTPQPPYYAVIFTSVRTVVDEGYSETAERMLDLAKQMPGYLGEESTRNDIGITVSYWASLEDISNWKKHPEHQLAQQNGREKWYSAYKTRICKVERDYEFG